MNIADNRDEEDEFRGLKDGGICYWFIESRRYPLKLLPSCFVATSEQPIAGSYDIECKPCATIKEAIY